jgi:Histidine kinase-, DNA gyrase B-, and HSP90-like ATPase
VTFGGIDAQVVDRIVLRPDPGLVESLGSNHDIGSAVADLIDNAIDADATIVLVRFLSEQHRLTALAVLDNGTGMNDGQINDAMTIGRRRDYRPRALGNFGIGLKAAALGCADTLTVWSHAAGGAAVGRRLRRQSLSKDFGCDVLAPDSAAGEAEVLDRTLGARSGTAVLLTEVRCAYRGASDLEAQKFLDTTVEQVKTHLGLVFHRWIENHGVRIDIEVVEATDSEESVPIAVPAVNPFGYRASGYPGYPRTLVARLDDSQQVELRCHIWPGRTDLTGFRMGTRSGDRFQGFYIYRADRLLQVGGWDSATTARPERQLARVVIEDDSIIGGHVTMNPEKQGIRFSPALLRAINKAVSRDGATTFEDYIADAESAYRSSRRRSRSRKPTVRPGKGFSPALRRAIADELAFIDGVEPIDIRWRRLPAGQFLDVDFSGRTIWLNHRYRELLVPHRGGLNDAPLVKALVYLLAREVFNGEYLGSRDRDDIALWKAVLGAAIREEESW